MLGLNNSAFIRPILSLFFQNEGPIRQKSIVYLLKKWINLSKMSINKFKMEEEVSGKFTKLIFSGNLNEHAVLSVPKPCNQLSVNLRDVSYINSLGTRSWCVWIKKIPPTTQITFEECPMLFVKAFSYVTGFLPDHAIVNSFYVPYVSEDSEESKIVLYRRGEHYDESGQLKVVSVLDSRGKAMELDVLNKYFAFLKR